jgi:hypothetical protein
MFKDTRTADDEGPAFPAASFPHLHSFREKVATISDRIKVFPKTRSGH